MMGARLSLALDGGWLVWPSEGRIALLHPSPDVVLPSIDRARAHIISDFKPDALQLQARGFDCATAAQGPYSAAVVCIPRAKPLARALIADAASRTEGVLVIDGQKSDGIDSLLRDMRKRVEVHGPITKAHGKLFWVTDVGGEAFADWAAGPALTEGGFWTAPGVFSADGIDPASALLVEVLPEDLGRSVADLGAGWGFLSAHVLTRQTVEEVHLVEAGYMALECAKHNVTDPRAQFHWEDATTWRPPQALDTVIMNPPFHLSRKADPQIGLAFIRAAAGALHAQGHLWMVANRHLPYESELQTLFASVEELDGDRRFKLLHASRPRRNKR
ncbi:MFS transporter [Roseobacter cerasinus]|uniref:MFS transporter n=1 Tax=Roseobacter cerasinus TaxID=2602289 RepID=A0A640VU44_9RHOB|nr:class I SAM-dependent methyltransferase [Roseobacter cerasinus]GFE51124.1 MFS transporter [Roseobacter cerasinus]